MKLWSFIFRILILLGLCSSFVSAQKSIAEFPAVLTIEQTISRLKEQNLYPQTASEISVVGAVIHSGTIKNRGELTLVQALAHCGGVQSRATGIVRLLSPNSDGGYREQLVDLKAVRTGKQQVTLRGGEIVIVLTGRLNFPRFPEFVFPMRLPSDKV